MTPHDLIAAFDALAEAPEAIARLRELVLQLAVRGKLVAQVPADEPASALLERLAAMTPLPRKHLRGRRRGAGTESDKPAPFDVVSGWCWARFEDVATIASNLVDPAEFRSEPHIAPDNIEKATGRLIGHRTIGEDGVTSGKHQFFPGQILYSKIRPNLSKVITVDFGGLCSADMYPIDPLIDRGYLHKFMLSEAFREQATSDDNRLAMPKVNQDQLSMVRVPVPPLAEQRRIVARLDQLMGLIDRLDAARSSRDATRAYARDSTLASLRQADTPEEVEVAWNRFAERMDELVIEPTDIAPLRQTVLELAVRGRLVTQDSTDGTGEGVIERVGQERVCHEEKGHLRRGAGRPPSVVADAPFSIPETWRWAHAADTCLIITDGDHQPPPQVEQGVPFVVIGNLSSGQISLTNARRVPQAYFDALDWTRKPSKGDLLYTVTGSYGIVLEVHDADPFCVQRHVGILKTARAFNNRYLAYALRSGYAFAYATSVATGTAQKTVPLSGLRRLPLPVPPRSEQNRIVERVDELMALLERLEARLDAARTTHAAFAAGAVHHLDEGWSRRLG